MSLRLTISHSVLSITTEKSYSPDLTVRELKQKLEMIVGTPPDSMILQVRDAEGEVLLTLQPDNKKLSEFHLDQRSRVHVVDTNPEGGVLSQISAFDQGLMNVPKYEIPAEAYKKRDDTFAKWKEKNLKEHFQKKEDEKKGKEYAWEDALKDIKVEARCEIEGKGLKHRGTVKYVGLTEFAAGPWVGVELDEPYGMNDGSVQGKTYFECQNKYGKFVRPDAVTIGDFPAVDELDDLESDEDEEL